MASLNQWSNPARIVLLAPFIFCVHVAEETPGFVQWFNSLGEYSISWDLFLAVNATALLITLVVAGVAAAAPSRATMLLAVGWLGFLMSANAILHLVGTVVHMKYSPGAVTSMILYLPYLGWFTSVVHKRLNVVPLKLLATALVAGLPMFIHGYLIVFKGSRLC